MIVNIKLQLVGKRGYLKTLNKNKCKHKKFR